MSYGLRKLFEILDSLRRQFFVQNFRWHLVRIRFGRIAQKRFWSANHFNSLTGLVFTGRLWYGEHDWLIVVFGVELTRSIGFAEFGNANRFDALKGTGQGVWSFVRRELFQRSTSDGRCKFLHCGGHLVDQGVGLDSERIFDRDRFIDTIFGLG